MYEDAQDAILVQMEPVQKEAAAVGNIAALNEKKPIKTLANCKPSEFIRQTYRIKKSAEKWMKATKIIEILRQKPAFKILPVGATAEERVAVIEENKKIEQNQGMRNFSQIVDMAFGENPEKTLEILALCCFVEPENVDDHPMSYYFEAMNELIHDEGVIGFFTSLASTERPTMRMA